MPHRHIEKLGELSRFRRPGIARRAEAWILGGKSDRQPIRPPPSPGDGDGESKSASSFTAFRFGTAAPVAVGSRYPVTNPYYTYSGSILPGMLGRAEAVSNEFQNVQTGFADLATAGVDTGSADAYVVTTPAGQPSGSLVDGDVVSFKAANTNSGAATLNVNGTVGRIVGELVPRPAGDIPTRAWTLIGATVTTFGGTISAAAPTKKVGLAASGGVSTAAAPTRRTPST
jgi:hypothetical protein